MKKFWIGFIIVLAAFGLIGALSDSPPAATTPQVTVTSTPKPHPTLSKETKRAYRICVQRRMNYIQQIPNTIGNCNDLPLSPALKSKALNEAQERIGL